MNIKKKIPSYVHRCGDRGTLGKAGHLRVAGWAAGESGAWKPGEGLLGTLVDADSQPVDF